MNKVLNLVISWPSNPHGQLCWNIIHMKYQYTGTSFIDTVKGYSYNYSCQFIDIPILHGREVNRISFLTKAAFSYDLISWSDFNLIVLSPFQTKKFRKKDKNLWRKIKQLRLIKIIDLLEGHLKCSTESDATWENTLISELADVLNSNIGHNSAIK